MKLTIEKLMAFKKWQEEGNRSVEVKFGEYKNKKFVQVFVYDFDLGEGQFANDPSEIDLMAKKRQQFEQLQLELEGLEA